MMGRAEGASRVLTKVNPPGLNRQIVIAFHSPDAHLETGLPMCPPEKSPAPYPFAADQCILSSPVW
jgi:hypothetical protein